MREISKLRVHVLALLLTAGCMPLGGPVVRPAEIGGPTISFVVTNLTNENRIIGYEFEGDGTSGAGDGEVPCGRTVMGFGGVAGSYVIVADGQEVASGDVPPAARVGSYLVFRVQIDEEGVASVAGPEIRAEPPDDRALLFENCS